MARAFAAMAIASDILAATPGEKFVMAGVSGFTAMQHHGDQRATTWRSMAAIINESRTNKFKRRLPHPGEHR